MATLLTRWLVTIMMAGLCLSYKGSFSHPSPPDCYIPCDDNGCDADIICTWDSNPEPNTNITYILRWEDFEIKTTDYSAKIQRHHFASHSELQVWVQAQNKDGEVNTSEPVAFNTAHILKPPPPNVTSTSQEPVELLWISPCDHLKLEAGQCEVRHRTEAEQAWTEPEEVSGSYTLDNPLPSTNYLFQVRCACGTSLMSNWSDIHAIRSAETAPNGKLDVWRDCGILLTGSDCVLTWKTLPMSQACGHVLGYTLSLFYNNRTIVSLNESAAAPMGALVCGEVQCYLKASLKDVKSVSISAYNAVGVTAPSHLDIIAPEKITKESIYLEMNKNNLMVSWDMPSWNTDNIKEYVVQYKEDECPLGQGFNWVRVNKSKANKTIKGQFKKYIAYQVSVFAVLNNNMELFFSSDITHFVQGVPAKVPLFKVVSYGSTHVTLFWKPVLLSKKNGITPYYQITVNKNNVYNVSAYPQPENRTFNLTDLIEDQEYELWIRAVNQAGPGPNTTVLFKTLSNENIALQSILLGFFGLVVIIIAVLVKKNSKEVCLSFCEKVPDPYNSKIIREIKHQINNSMPWLCIPETEQHPILLSSIEIVAVPPSSFNSPPDNITKIEGEDTLEDIITVQQNKTQYGKQEYSKMIDSDEDDSRDSSEEDHSGYEKRIMPTNIEIMEEHIRAQHRCGREGYSKITDSDEEKNKHDHSWSSEEEDFSSGYERHFMPTVSEIMEV